MSDKKKYPGLSFKDWLVSLKVLFPLLGIVLSAYLGILAPDKIIPKPLYGLNILSSLIILVSIILNYVWRENIIKRIKLISSFTFILLLILLGFHTLFVEKVSYQNPSQEIYYLVGFSYADSNLQNTPDEIVIKQAGGDMQALKTTYKKYILITFLYSITYLLLLNGIVFSLGGIMLKNKSPQRNQQTNFST